MLISHEKKFIFIKAHKVAGTSVEMAFQQFCQPDHLTIKENCDEIISDKGIIGCRKNFENAKKFYWQNHLNTKQIKDKLNNNNIFNNYFKFAIARNPFDRIKSAYHHFGVPNKYSFKEYVKTTTLKSLYNFYCLDQYDIDYFIRFESLQNGLQDVCKKIDIDYNKINLGHFKKGNTSRHYADYYDNQTKKIVEQKYWKDIEYFGYRFAE